MVALITPFNEDGSVNYKRLRELIDWHVDQQTDAILVLGTTAETPTLTVSEEDEIARISIEQAKGRVPIIVGSGSNNTMVAIEQSLKYEKMGADGLLVITPYYNKASKAGMVNHFMQVADAVHTPVYVYNVPGRTGVSLTYEALAEISQHKNIVGIKEASGNMSLICQFSKLINENFNVYSGNDDINVALMSMGGAGSISVMRQHPAEGSSRHRYGMSERRLRNSQKDAAEVSGLHQCAVYRNKPDPDQGSYEHGRAQRGRIQTAALPDGGRHKGCAES